MCTSTGLINSKVKVPSEGFEKKNSTPLYTMSIKQCICSVCNSSFTIRKSVYNNRLKTRKNYEPTCSQICCRKKLKTSINVECKNCLKNFEKELSQVRKWPNHFCCKSCAATYNNKHKSHGTRRSKLEVYLEEQIRLKYPNLILECNSKSAINSELDFYFPELRFAIELNGVVHYEPIYGNDKFEKIQDNDKQKLIQCYLKGIELTIVDSSTCKYLNQSAKDKYLSIISELVNKVLSDRFELPLYGSEPCVLPLDDKR